jgi:G3E family GTPase
VQQVAYADRIVLNKADLVTPAELETLRARLAAINASAPLTVATMASVDVAAVLETRGFDLEAVAETLAAAPCGNPAHGEPGHVCGGGHDHGHAHHDHGHEGGLNLGLWRRKPDSIADPSTRKPIYDVFVAADTPRREEAFRFALPIIGITNWAEVLP